MAPRTKSSALLAILACLLCACSTTKPITTPPYLVDDMPDLNKYDRPPELIRSVKPEYDPARVQMGMSGKVTLKLLVLKDGTVGKIQVLEASNPILANSAVKAASGFIFKPATKNGRPTRATVVIPFVFKGE